MIVIIQNNNLVKLIVNSVLLNNKVIETEGTRSQEKRTFSRLMHTYFKMGCRSKDLKPIRLA